MMNNLRSTMPYKVNVNITNMCNSRCKTCNLWKTKSSEGELTTVDFTKLFRDLGKNLLWLHLTGGEPFLKKEYVDVVKLALQYCPNILVIDSSTNGLMSERIEKTIVDVLKTDVPVFGIGVSFDGPPKLHEYIRGIKGSWTKTLETYKRLLEISKRDVRLKVHINYTLSNLNVGRTQEFFDAFESSGLILDYSDLSFSIVHLGVSFKNTDLDKILPSVNMQDKFIQDLEKSMPSFNDIFRDAFKVRALPDIVNIGREVIKRLYIQLGIDYIKDSSKMVLPCAACFANCWVDANGDVYPCTIWDFKLGNLKKQSFKEIWLSEKSNEARRLIRKEQCPNCWSCEADVTILQNLEHLPFKLLKEKLGG